MSRAICKVIKGDGTFNKWSEGDGERHHSRVLWFFLFVSFSGRGRQPVVLMECEPLVCGKHREYPDAGFPKGVPDAGFTLNDARAETDTLGGKACGV